MNLFGVMDVSATALRAERVRAEVTASNMANAETTRGTDGTPYKRQQVLFQETTAPANLFASHFQAPDRTPAGGVQVSEVSTENASIVKRFDPSHPDADADGYVSYPDINPLTEMVDLMGATRAYGLNVSAIQAEKNMLTASLDILR